MIVQNQLCWQATRVVAHQDQEDAPEHLKQLPQEPRNDTTRPAGAIEQTGVLNNTDKEQVEIGTIPSTSIPGKKSQAPVCGERQSYRYQGIAGLAPTHFHCLQRQKQLQLFCPLCANKLRQETISVQTLFPITN